MLSEFTLRVGRDRRGIQEILGGERPRGLGSFALPSGSDASVGGASRAGDGATSVADEAVRHGAGIAVCYPATGRGIAQRAPGALPRGA